MKARSMPYGAARGAVIMIAALAQPLQAQDVAPGAPGEESPAPPPEEAPAAPAEAAPTEEAPAAPVEEAPAEEAPAEAPPAEAPSAENSASAQQRVIPEPTFEPAAVEVEEPEHEDGGEIIVTGSRVKRSSFAASAPVQVIGSEEIAYSGAKNLADVVRHLTSNGSSDLLGRGFAAAGTSSVNLRGLGTQATLVLINGRRFMPSGAGVETVFYDLNTVPIASIERIEILRGGASSIYGSDAVAGVVNIITKKNWTGMSAEVGGQTTDRFDHAERDVSLAVGMAEGPVSMNLGASYNYRDELMANERDWTKGTVTTVAGNPINVFTTGGGYYTADPDCELAQGTSIDEHGQCVFDFGSMSNLVGERELLSTFGSAEYDVSEHTAVYMELGYTRMRSQSTATPSLPVLPSTVIPADHIDNPDGVGRVLVGQILPLERGPERVGFGDDSVRTLFGLKGDLLDAARGSFAEEWEWDLSGSWSASLYNGFLGIETIHDNLVEALNSCSDRSDLSGCFNPYYSAYTGEGTPNSQEVIDRLRGRLMWATESKLTTADAGLTGPLFELPGGDLGLAIGAQYRLEERLTRGDHDAEQLAYSFFFGFTSAEAKKNVLSGYVELVWPFLDGLELQTAARVEDHENSGTNASPSAGLLMTPVLLAGGEVEDGAFDRLHLRGTITQAFRAPSLYQTFPGFATSVTTFNVAGIERMRPVLGFGNPDAQPEVALATSGGFDWTPIDELSLSADYWRYMYDDRVVAENALQIYRADPNDPRVLTDEFGALTGVQIKVVNVGETVTHGIDYSVMLHFDLGSKTTLSIGNVGTVILGYEIPRALIVGEELRDDDTNEIIPGPDGRPQVAYPNSFDCSGDVCNVVGGRNSTNLAGPVTRLRMNVPLVFESYGHAATLTAHYVSGLEDDQNASETGVFPLIDAMTTFDLQYAYTLEEWIGWATTVRVGVINVLDSDPPWLKTTWGYLAGIHDPRGRMVYARLEQDF